jgi:hypothetical protein
VNRFTGYSQIVTTNNYNTLKITITITHKVFNVCFLSRLLIKNLSWLKLQLLSCLLNSLTTESESYITIDGQSASLSWNKAPIWGLRQDFYYCQTFVDLLIWGALSDEWMGLSFTISTGPRQRRYSRVRVSWDSRPYFTVSDSRLPFSSSFTTRRATVEVFDPASTRSDVSPGLN